MLPRRIHVIQVRDDLAPRVGMDSSVLGAAMAADRDGMRQAREIEIELVLESFTERLRRELIEELAECGSIRQLVNRKASALGDAGVIAIDFRARFGPDEAGDDHILEGLACERDGPESIKVEITYRHSAVSRVTSLFLPTVSPRIAACQNSRDHR